MAILLSLLGLAKDNWRGIALLTAVLSLFGFGWHSRGQWDESRLKDALSAQVITLQAQCAEEQKLTKGANDALQKSVFDITAKLNTAKRVHHSLCVRPISGVAEHPAGGREHAGQNGISTDWLRDFAAECEQYRSEVIILNDFGNKLNK